MRGQERHEAGTLTFGTLACVLAVVGCGCCVSSGGTPGRRRRFSRASSPAVLGSWHWAWRKLGGYTGDVLGAAGLAAETAGLVVAAGKW